MDKECIFCKIIAGEIPSNKIFENENVFAFYDINPQVKKHILVIPKMHISSCNEISNDNVLYISEIFKVIPEIASLVGLENGYRVVTNYGEDGCQSVHHMHFHVLGGEKLSEKLG